ncbi:MAG: hypothetical protein VB013_04745 [Anaerolineaceae bacterium]|nr:hypothetical protein [Anaerolineaceae bacterium]
MKRYALFLASLLVAAMLLLGACAQAPAPTATLQPTAAATATEIIPTPTATEEPILPCNIVFDSDRDGNREIYSMAPDGSNQVNLSNDPADDTDPVWSPDGSQIAFTSDRPTDEGGRYIYIMQADGSDVRKVSTYHDSQRPDWSPLGNQIVYEINDDIYLLDLAAGTEVNLTNSPDKDEQAKFSPDGTRIAWLRGGQVYVMNVDGSNPTQVTRGGEVAGVDWSVDGRLYSVWEQPDGICKNCIYTTDGNDIQDAGGKGSIQQFLPFWTDEGDRVEMGFGDINHTGHEDVFLVGEIFPDVFKFLTHDAGNNMNTDIAAQCGPTHGLYPQYGSQAEEPVSTSGGPFTIGYTGSIDGTMQQDFETACSELENITCVHGENITALIDQGVDAIINASNRWDLYGSGPAVHDAVGAGIPVFMLNADSDEPNGVFNLSVEKEVATTSLVWMIKSMNDKGEIALYNFGDSGLMNNIIENELKDRPEISPYRFTPSYEGSNPFSDGTVKALLTEHPSIGGIWSSEPQQDLFWLLKDDTFKNKPLFECIAKKEILIEWKNQIDAGSTLQCVSFIRPGGMAYDGVYAAFFYLNGSKFRSDAFAQGSTNTLRFDLIMITNETIPLWIGPKLEALNGGENELYTVPHLTPQEIKSLWFE